MKQIQVRILALLAGAALLLTSVGCENSRSGNQSGTARVELKEKEVQEVEFQTASVGEEVEAQQVSATLEHAYLSDYTFTEKGAEIGLTFFELTIHNNTEDELNTNFLNNCFAITVDGEGYAGISIRSIRFLKRQFGDDVVDFNEPIPAGETRTGYVCAEVPAEFLEIRFLYFPAACLADWSQCFTFDFTREAMEIAPAPVKELEGVVVE